MPNLRRSDCNNKHAVKFDNEPFAKNVETSVLIISWEFFAYSMDLEQIQGFFEWIYFS